MSLADFKVLQNFGTLLKFLIFFLQELTKTVAKLAEDGKVYPIFYQFTFLTVFSPQIFPFYLLFGYFHLTISTHKRPFVLLSCFDCNKYVVSVMLFLQVAIRNIRRDAIKAYDKLQKVCCSQLVLVYAGYVMKS